MVRNDRLKKTGESTKLIAEFVEERRRAKSLTQKQIASALGEKTSQSYVSVRLRGKAAWTMDDLDAIAPLIDFDNAIELIGNLARKRAAVGKRARAACPSVRSHHGWGQRRSDY